MRKVFRFAAVAALIAAVLVNASSSAGAFQSSWCTSHARVAILGASSETGYGTTGYPAGAETYVPTTYGWTLKYANDLHATWGTVVDNYSHNGAMVSDYLPGGRWTSTSAATTTMGGNHPNLVVVNLGGNELWSQVDPAVFATNLANLIDNIRATVGNVDIMLEIYPELKWAPNPYGGNTQRFTWTQYGDVIYQTAVAKGVGEVDMRQYIPPAAASQQPSPSPWLSDNIHLNDTGNLVEYGAWWGWTSAIASLC